MNERQVAFIVCTNNDMYYEECVRYIQELEVPEGYSTDIICIQEADSMTQGYNAGMYASDAKYKVYLHQDTFIINRKFIEDTLHIFQLDDKIGMIGVLGAKTLSKDANCYLDWRFGKIEACDGLAMMNADFLRQPENRCYEVVKAIDGMIMITRHDVAWREDILDGWDFYDISQSLEMQKNGYQVVIPYQETAWCYHDCGCPNLEKYDFYRKRMLGQYTEYFGGVYNKMNADEKQEERKTLVRIREMMIRLFALGDYEELLKIASEISPIGPLDTQIREMLVLMEIYQIEERSLEKKHSMWYNFSEWQQIRELYKWVSTVLKRIEWKRDDVRISELKEMVHKGYVTKDALIKISEIVLKNNTNVLAWLQD